MFISVFMIFSWFSSNILTKNDISTPDETRNIDYVAQD